MWQSGSYFHFLFFLTDCRCTEVETHCLNQCKCSVVLADVVQTHTHTHTDNNCVSAGSFEATFCLHCPGVKNQSHRPGSEPDWHRTTRLNVFPRSPAESHQENGQGSAGGAGRDHADRRGPEGRAAEARCGCGSGRGWVPHVNMSSIWCYVRGTACTRAPLWCVGATQRW